jgi:hypothetical protein
LHSPSSQSKKHKIDRREERERERVCVFYKLIFLPALLQLVCFEAEEEEEEEEEENTHCKANPSDGGQTERTHNYPLQKGFRVSHLFGASPHISSCSTPGRTFFLYETHSLLLLLLLFFFFL